MSYVHMVIQQLALTGHPQCTKEEKLSLMDRIRNLLQLMKNVRREGMLWLDEIISDEKDRFLRCCLQYITEVSYDPQEFQEYAAILMFSSPTTGIRLLETAIIADGLAQILLNRTPEATLRRLGAWLGTDCADEIEMELVSMKQMEQTDKLESLFSRKQSIVPDFDRLATLSNEQLSQLLDTIEPVTLAVALQGASSSVLHRLKERMTSTHWNRMVQLISSTSYPRHCDIEHAQRKIIHLLTTEE